LLIAPTAVIAEPLAEPLKPPEPQVYVDFSELVVKPDYTLCNCFLFVKQTYNLPRMNDVIAGVGAEGEVAVFYYSSNGLHHFAKVIERGADYVVIEETNYNRCKHSIRKIMLTDPSLLGFYDVAE